MSSDHPDLSVSRQCALPGISRSGSYDVPVGESETNLALMRLIDQPFMEMPFYGWRPMTQHLRRSGNGVGFTNPHSVIT